MKALCYHGPRSITYDSAPDPKLENDRDVVIKTLGCSICGSDLHIYHGFDFTEQTGFCVGHEVVGEVVEMGAAVRMLKIGDQVMIPGAISCGSCPQCLKGNVRRCVQGLQVYGQGRSQTSYQGSQAEAVRIPAADFNARRIPDGVSVEQALMLTDALPTAWLGCRNADIRPGVTVAIVGLGPIGLMAVQCAFALGAARVFAIDLVPERRAMAERLGAEPLEPSVARQAITEATHGALAECVVDAVGADATLALALRLAGNEGTVSLIGVNTSQKFEFPVGRALVNNLTFRAGLCSIQPFWPELIPLVQQGRIRPEQVITHRLPLSQGEEAYRIFDGRLDGTLKMVLTP